ncbi:MAG: acylphosphatase [Thiobacillus sp.]|nr:acylphosphatase [Thiobacillus sp.]
MRITRQLKIYGQVQGVFFRDSMCREAARLHIGGWVRNCADGSVEAVVQGSAEAVDAMIAWAWQGSARARVSQVEVAVETGEFDRFERLPTA